MDSDLNDALAMLGIGYEVHAPPVEIFGTASGYTPAPDALCKKYGFVTAMVWGRVWRFCQGRDGVCRAKLETIAQSLGMSERTIIRHMDVLVKGGYFVDLTPDLRNKPHTYADTRKLRLAFSTDIIESGVTESHPAMTESHRQGDRESHEDSNINRQSNIQGAQTAPLESPPLSIDNAIFTGTPVTPEILSAARDADFVARRDVALMQISRHGCDLEPLARAAMDVLGVAPAKKHIRGWAGCLREMLTAGVKSEHILMAKTRLEKSGALVNDVFSLQKTAIALAAQPVPVSVIVPANNLGGDPLSLFYAQRESVSS